MLIQSPALGTLKRVRHAFFTREGGVSEGVYASLNGGLGSNDDRARVNENRKRMTAALEVAEGALAMAFQVHSPDAVVATHPWTQDGRPRADAVVTATPESRRRHHDRRLRARAARRRSRGRGRRRARGLEGRA